MRVLHSWLRQYLAFKLSPGDLAERLSMLGLEVASVERLGDRYAGFVVGTVVSCERHPHADRLTVCSVNAGRDILQIVCGAPNVAAGQKVAVGLPGARVPKAHGAAESESLELAVRNVRGVESQGMICSEYELDFGKDAEGILVLDPTARAGQTLTEYFDLDDVVYELEITPNRPDWLSHIGVAREIGLLVGRKAKLPAVRLREGETTIGRFLSVRVEDREDCPRFAARMLRGVRLGPSPLWLRNRLRNVGLRPVNNVVDVTNFVMLETGHPLHAFDYALLRGGGIVVRRAIAGSHFATLDGRSHTLPEGTVMVCDAEREVSIAGVMGGANSEIRESTTDVVLEAAYWNPSSIRRTSKALGISTDASQRFERGADPNAVGYALDRAAQLVQEMAGGTLLRGRIDVYPRKVRPRSVSFRPSRANELLGIHLSTAEIRKILRALDVTPASGGKGRLRCTVPTGRVDIEREVDLIEEVARVYGYDRIPEKTRASIDVVQPFPRVLRTDTLGRHLASAGFQESITNPMQDGWRAGLTGVTAVSLLNPLSQDLAFLRTSLVPGLLDVVQRNVSHGNTTLRLFELGHVFTRTPGPHRASVVEGFFEGEHLAIVLTGMRHPFLWHSAETGVDFFDIKGIVETLLGQFTLDKWRLISYSTSDGLTDNPLTIDIQGSYAGYLGRVRDSVLERFGVRQPVYVAELLPAALAAGKRYFSPLPKYPRVRRDVALVVDRDVSAAELEDALRGGAGDLLQSVGVFDVFEDTSLGEGKKSLAFALELQSRDRTLTDHEIDQAVRAAIDAASQKCGAVLRGTVVGA